MLRLARTSCLCLVAACADSPGATATADDGAARPGAGADATSCAGAAVCEDFETTGVGSVPGGAWTVSTPNCSGTGTLAVSSAQAHSGARSLEVHGGNFFCDHVFLSSAAPATVTGTLHVRFFVRFAAAFGDAHTTFLAGADASDGRDLRMGGQSHIFMWNRELNDATLPALSPAGIALSVAPAANTWYCVQAAITGTAHTLQTAIDGSVRSGLVIDGTPTPDVDQQWLNGPAWTPRLQNLRFGWEAYSGTPMTLWFDDIAIGASPIPCG